MISPFCSWLRNSSLPKERENRVLYIFHEKLKGFALDIQIFNPPSIDFCIWWELEVGFLHIINNRMS